MLPELVPLVLPPLEIEPVLPVEPPRVVLEVDVTVPLEPAPLELPDVDPPPLGDPPPVELPDGAPIVLVAGSCPSG